MISTAVWTEFSSEIRALQDSHWRSFIQLKIKPKRKGRTLFKFTNYLSKHRPNSFIKFKVFRNHSLCINDEAVLSWMESEILKWHIYTQKLYSLCQSSSLILKIPVTINVLFERKGNPLVLNNHTHNLLTVCLWEDFKRIRLNYVHVPKVYHFSKLWCGFI